MSFDSTTISFPHEALELSRASSRKLASVDNTPTTVEFEATVLTSPIPLSNGDIGMFFGETPATTAAATPGANVVGRFYFKARIVPKGAYSPHEFLADPCNADQVDGDNLNDLIDLISMHTTCMSLGGYHGKIPKIGDTVLIELKKHTKGVGPYYDASYATFKHIIDGSTRSDPAILASRRCADELKTVFEEGDISLLGTPEDGHGPGSAGSTPHFERLIPESTNARIPTAGAWTSPYTLSRQDPVQGNSTRPHNGIDIAAPTGRPVHPILPGIVLGPGEYGAHSGRPTPYKSCMPVPSGVDRRTLSSGQEYYSTHLKCNHGLGNTVYIRHENGLISAYHHLQNGSVRFEAGKEVGQDHVIGRVGDTGHSTGPHLHFILYRSRISFGDPNQHVDPIQALGWEEHFTHHRVSVESVVV
tara:strand:+ start:75 stop:1325 length:1251 start_codon:yes stop_codon:yes gene_type:complete